MAVVLSSVVAELNGAVEEVEFIRGKNGQNQEQADQRMSVAPINAPGDGITRPSVSQPSGREERSEGGELRSVSSSDELKNAVQTIDCVAPGIVVIRPWPIGPWCSRSFRVFDFEVREISVPTVTSLEPGGRWWSPSSSTGSSTPVRRRRSVETWGSAHAIARDRWFGPGATLYA
jgi:hypothetical protein